MQQYFTAKIIFEDKTLGEISKNYLPVIDANGDMQDVTYKIKHDKNNGKMSLRFFSMVAVQQNYIVPNNVTVVHFGNPQVIIPTTTVTQTTTTQTNTNTTNIDATLNVPGINMNVTITDPLYGTVEHTSTTTRTTTHNHQNTGVPEPPRQVGCNNAYPMSSSDFNSAVSTVKAQGFNDTKLKTAKQIASANCLSTAQITTLCQLFGFEETKLDFAKYALDYCTEKKNYFKLNSLFSFSSSVDELTEYVQNHQ